MRDGWNFEFVCEGVRVTVGLHKLGNEMGFVVRQRKRPMILKKFSISLVENDYGPIRFRLNLYAVENGLPTTTLLKENIIIETDIASGIVTKDLSAFQIVIDEDFFVAIESQF